MSNAAQKFYNQDAEIKLLAAILNNGDDALLLIYNSGISGPDWSEGDHRRVYEAACHLYEKGEPVIEASIKAELERTNRKLVNLTILSDYANDGYIAPPDLKWAIDQVRLNTSKRNTFGIVEEYLPEIDKANGSMPELLVKFGEAIGAAANSYSPEITLPNAANLLTQTLAETAWAVPEMLPAGFTILGGKPKMGKSWLALQISLAVCSGGKIFGRDVPQGKVLYLALEDGPKRLQKRLKIQGWDAESAKNLDYLFLREFMAKIGPLHQGGSQALAARIEQAGYKMVVIDTVGRSLPGLKSQNEYQAVSDAFGPIQEMAISHDCSVLGIDHHNKLAGGSGVTPDAVNDVQGSISKGGIADAVWGLYKSRTKTEALLQIDGRDIEEIMSLAVRMDRETAAWQCDGDYYEKKQSEARQAILDALADEGAMLASEIAGHIGRKRPNVTRDMKILVAEKLVNRDPEKKYHLITERG